MSHSFLNRNIKSQRKRTTRNYSKTEEKEQLARKKKRSLMINLFIKKDS